MTDLQQEPRIENMAPKRLAGKKLHMSFSNDRTFELWSSFMPIRMSINNTISQDMYSVRVFSALPDFRNFNPSLEFEKWAAIEVAESAEIQPELEALILTGGLYAVFLYKGIPADAAPFYRYIYQTWLPASEYILDDRPHFEVMGAKYKHNDPESEEEVWIPVRRKP